MEIMTVFAAATNLPSRVVHCPDRLRTLRSFPLVNLFDGAALASFMAATSIPFLSSSWQWKHVTALSHLITRFSTANGLKIAQLVPMFVGMVGCFSGRAAASSFVNEVE